MNIDVFQKIIDILAKNPNGIPQSYIHRSLSVSKAYISIILKGMEKQGIIYRTKIGNTYIVKLAGKAPLNNKVLRLGIVWSSEYLFLGHFAKTLKNLYNIDLTVNVYSNALQATLAIIRGEIDAVLSPLVTQLYAYILSRNIVIAGGGAGGGATLYEFPKSKTDIIISSEASSMDLCRLIASKRKIIEHEGVRYFTTPNEALEFIKRGKARYAVIWHPLTEFVKPIEHRVVIDCGEFEEIKHCCTLALSKFIGIENIEKISAAYRNAIIEFLHSPVKFIDWYSSITNIDSSILRKALNAYRYTYEIDSKDIQTVVDAININIPQKHAMLNAIIHI
jgi:predicted transcriptional regulator